jgi:photosystem II stability/assembly factor-like uncharacterized protein
MDDGSDDLERRLRNVLRSRRLNVDAAPDALNRIHAGVARRRQRRTAMSSAATLAIVGVVVAAVVVRPHERPAIGADQQHVSSSADSLPPTQPSGVGIRPSPTGTTGSSISPVTPPNLPSMSASDASNAPTTFNAVSVSAVSADHFWVLGYSMTTYADGASGGGATILSTTDGGAHFSKTGTIDVIVAQVPMSRPYGVPTVSDIRFGDATHGWAFGDALYETDDAGATWSQTTEVPGAVVDLVATNNVAWAVVDLSRVLIPHIPPALSDDNHYAIYSTSYGKGPQHWARVSIPFALGVAQPSIVDQDGTVTILADGPAQEARGPHVLVAARGHSFIDHVGPCKKGEGGVLSNSAASIWAACPIGDDASMVTSADRGKTWNSPQTPLTFSSFGGHIGALDAQHALVDTADGTLLRLSSDGTRTSVATPDSASSIAFIGFTTADVGYVVASTDEGYALWRTTDGGLHWSTVTIHG